jgi:hypothetical protein
LRDKITGRLRVVRREAHAPGVEPLARAVRDAMDAADNMTPAEAARLTGLKPQHISQILNRTEPYGRLPTISTQQALAKIPGLSAERIARAIFDSTGQPAPTPPDMAQAGSSALRRSVHGLVDQIAEEDLARALKVLSALL